MGEVRRQDPMNRINGDPPEGMSWTIVAHPTGDESWLKAEHRGSYKLCRVEGPTPETTAERKERLLKEGIQGLKDWAARGMGGAPYLREDTRKALQKILESERL